MSALDEITKQFDRVEASLKERHSTVTQLTDRVAQLEQKGFLKPGGGTRSGDSRSFGEKTWESLQANMELLGKTSRVRLEIKAAGDPVTTSSGRRLVYGGAGAPSSSLVLGLQNALPQRPTGGGISAVEYSRYTGQQGGAAQQATEGADKAAVRPDHSIITQSALTVAGYTKMSRQALNDMAEVKNAIDVVLARSVGVTMDTLLTTGGANFAGGISGLATAYTSLVYTALVDATSEGVATMQTAGFQPDVVALNPADWLAITVAKGSDGHYLSGAYLGLLPENMRGLRVVLSPSVAAGKSLLLDSAHTELQVVDVFAVEAAYAADDFTKNLVTILGETRVVPVFRTVGAARLITPKA